MIRCHTDSVAGFADHGGQSGQSMSVSGHH